MACDSLNRGPEQLDPWITDYSQVLSCPGDCAASSLHRLNLRCRHDTNQVFDPPSIVAFAIFYGRLVLASVLAVTLMQSNSIREDWATIRKRTVNFGSISTRMGRQYPEIRDWGIRAVETAVGGDHLVLVSHRPVSTIDARQRKLSSELRA